MLSSYVLGQGTKFTIRRRCPTSGRCTSTWWISTRRPCGLSRTTQIRSTSNLTCISTYSKTWYQRPVHSCILCSSSSSLYAENLLYLCSQGWRAHKADAQGINIQWRAWLYRPDQARPGPEPSAGPDLSVWRPWAGSLLEAPTHPQML